MSINGMDCMCEAQHEGQCSCGCDWTTTKEARLQALNAELLAACKAKDRRIRKLELLKTSELLTFMAEAEVSDE